MTIKFVQLKYCEPGTLVKYDGDWYWIVQHHQIGNYTQLCKEPSLSDNVAATARVSQKTVVCFAFGVKGVQSLRQLLNEFKV